MICSTNIFFVSLILINFSIITGCNKDDSPQNRDCTNPSIEQLIKVLPFSKKFSDIFMSADTIRLETHRNGLIGVIDQVCKSPKGYIVLDRSIVRQVFMFNHEGKFIKVLGAKGEGPREYREPSYIFVDKIGNSYILDSSLRKIIKYSLNGNFLEEISFRNLKIYPTAFFIIDANDTRSFLFYNTHPDFGGKSRSRKVIRTEYRAGRLSYKKSFGTSEPLLRTLYYDTGTFDIAPTGEIWIGRIFDLHVELYTLNGKKIKTIKDHLKLLPSPYISLTKFIGFNRISQSLDTYYKLTRLSDFIFLNDTVIGIYFSENKTHILFFDPCGNPLNASIIEDKYPLASAVVGSWNNKFYVMVEAQDIIQDTGEVPNPMLVGYTLR